MVRSSMNILTMSLLVSGQLAVGSTIELWDRAPGRYFDGNEPKKAKKTTVDLKKKKTSVRKLHDLQYGETRAYKTVSLGEIITGYTYNPEADYALLHSSNESLIPVDLNLLKNKRFQIFVALARKDGKSWKSSFEPVSRKDEKFRDPTPLEFKNSNKIIPGKMWLPKPKDRKKAFSPWKHFGSLVGIEFINRKAYDRQLNVKTSLKGFAVFRDRCQYCHAVRDVGAKYGWDFVIPLPIYKKRPVNSLFGHVRYPKMEAIELGMFMPHQPDFTKAEAQLLWTWLRHVTKAKLRGYYP